MLWGYYVSPMAYGQNAIVINEFLDERWSKVRKHFSHSCFSLSIGQILQYKDKFAINLNSYHN